MTWLSLGNLALPTQLNRHGAALRSEIGRIGTELTTGLSAEPQRKLRGDLAPLAAVEARMARIAAYTETTRFAANAAAAAQTGLDRAAAGGSEIGSRMLLVAVEGTAPETLRSASVAAAGALDDLTSALNQRIAGRVVFAGTASDTAPLPDGPAILAALAPALSGLTSADAIAAAVQSAFMDPGGLFETTIYQGGPAANGAAIDAGINAPALPTAADPALRRLMAGLAIAALAGDSALPLADNQRRALAQTGAEALMGAAPGLAEAQASLGETQARLDTGLTRLTGERDALSLTLQDLVGADTYEAVTRLEEAQTQLEILYAFTARTARLSLTEYL